MLQLDVRVVVRPNDTIDIARKSNEESAVGEFFYCAFDYGSGLDIIDLEDLLLDNRGFQGQLEETVEREMTNDPCSMYSADFVRPGDENARKMLIGHL